MKTKKINGYKVFRICNLCGLILLSLLILFPIVNLLAVSLSSSPAVLAGKVSFYPVDFSLQAYSEIAEQMKFWTGYRNSVFYMSAGTIISVSLVTMCAYPLSKRDFFGASAILKFVVFTMFFSGGLIPFYLIIRSLGMLDTVWAILLPGAVSAYNVLIMKTFFMGIPTSLAEAAEMDGLSQLGILVRITLPLSKAIIATIALFNAVWYWNDWFNALILLNKETLQPVTLYLRNIMMGSVMSAQAGGVDASSARSVSQTLQAASTMLVILPMLLVYPFVQKYFAKGVMIGSVKG